MKRLEATRVYYGLELLLSMPTWVVVSIYLVRELHLSPLELVLMGTAMEGAVFLFEIPTGVVADTYSRRLSLIIGFVGMGVTWMLVGVFSTPWVIILLWAVWGLAYTFTSGAYQAWITDEVGADKVGRVFLRGARVGYIGAFAGLVALVALGTESLRAAVVAGGAVTLLCGLACIVFMPETGFRRRPRAERAHALAELAQTARSGARYARAQRVVMLLIAVQLFMGMSAEAFDRLKEAHFLRDIGLPSVGHLSPVVWFGIFALVAMVFGFVAVGRLMKRLERAGRGGVARWLFVFTAAEMAAVLVFALTGSTWVAVATLLAILLARGLANPLYDTWLNEQITDSSVRATVISISGQANAIGQAGGGPVLGAIGNVWGLGAALSAGGLLIAPALGLYARAIGRQGREPELDDLPPAEAYPGGV
ncbi:MAG: MFS transporter [Actinobacteria bacterium]|nr:MFS transporter [Actinomycetota bacterium]